MQSSGRIRVYAPKCTTDVITIGAMSSTICGTGDSNLTTAVAAGVAGTALVVAEGVGFVNGQTLIVSYGTDQEEECVVAAHTPGTGPDTIAITSIAFVNDHPVGARVVVKPTQAFRPGSVVVKDVGDIEAVDNGKGGFQVSATNTTPVAGYVDYATGAIQVTLSAAAGAVTATVDVLADNPSQSDADGSGYFVNHQGGLNTRKYIPDYANVTNLGDTSVGVFVEVSKNGGKSWSSRGTTALHSPEAGASLKSMGRGLIRSPGGRIDMLRVRAGAASGETEDPTLTTVQAGQVEFDYHLDTSLGAMGA